MAVASLRFMRLAGTALLIVLALIATGAVFAQRPSPAEGPWSGWAQCVVVAKWADYLDEQTHTWTLTGEAPTPTPRGSAQVYYTWPAMWNVQGGGRRTWVPHEPGASGREQSERWTIANDMKMVIRVTDLGTGRLRIGAEGQRGAPLGALRVTESSGRTRDAPVQPWPFPAIEDNALSATIAGTSTRTYPEGFGVGWGQPPMAITTATCTWSFTRSGVGPRTIDLQGFSGRGTAFVGPRIITATSGFTARGTAFLGPRTITVTGWTGNGEEPIPLSPGAVIEGAVVK